VISRFVYAMEKMGAIEFRKIEQKVSSSRRFTEPPRPTAPPRSYEKIPVRESTSIRVTDSNPRIMDSGRVPDSERKVADCGPSKQPQQPGSSSARLEETFGVTGMGRRLVDPQAPTHPPAEEEKKEGKGPTFVRMEVQKSEKKMEEEHHIKVAEQFYRL